MLCCVNCFLDPEIRQFIEEGEELDDCDFCGSKEINVRDVDEVGEFIKDGILGCYEDAAESVPYESAEGGYQYTTMNIFDILEEQDIFSDLLDDPTQLIDAFEFDGTIPYVRHDLYVSEPDGREQIRNWKEFGNYVKNTGRFTIFFKSSNDTGGEKYSDFLKDLAEKMGEFISVLDAGTKIYRARLLNDEITPNHKNLTSPMPHKTKNNRMSPAGISYFYGGTTEAVCIAEIRPSVGEAVAVAEFEVLKDLTILDLSIEPDPPKSIFNEEYSFTYEEYIKPFLSHFMAEIAKPIRPTDSEIDYIPTQVFAELIKIYNFKELEFLNDIKRENQPTCSNTLNGIKFKSSLLKNGINLVLFRGPDISTKVSTIDDKAWLLYKGFKRFKITGIDVSYQKVKKSSSKNKKDSK